MGGGNAISVEKMIVSRQKRLISKIVICNKSDKESEFFSQCTYYSLIGIFAKTMRDSLFLKESYYL